MTTDSCRIHHALRVALFLALLLYAGASGVRAQQVPQTKPTAQEATAFVDAAEKQLLDLWIAKERASWVLSNFITFDTEIIAAEAAQQLTAKSMELAKAATRFDGLELPADVARKLMLLKLSLTIPAPSNPSEQAELAQINASLEGDYGKGRFYPEGPGSPSLDLGDMERIISESRNPDTLLMVWKGWRTISPPMRQRYQRMVELANKGALELGYTDVGALWRAGYDMTPDAFSAELERLWQQVKPLYDALHAYVRTALAKKYGPSVVQEDGLIPADLLGNMWAQDWSYIYDLVAPKGADPGYDLTTILREKKFDDLEMVRYGERFFLSLGLDSLPPTFWTRSLFVKPRDRDVVCHASAWDIDWVSDLRIKMCIKINNEDFETIHHELGHNFYQYAYNHQPPLFRSGANDGFHEALGDVIALSVTPEYLKKVHLLEKVPDRRGDIGLLLKMALNKVAFLPFGLLVDQWRWKVFSGQIRPEDYNKAWWELCEKYQGVKSPVPRSEADFDPGAKYHIPANVPYTRYFLGTILQFQFHRALCREAGETGPLNRSSIYGSTKAGERLKKMMAMGQSRPWPEALVVLTGQSKMDASALLEYFAPLKQWLDEQNKGHKVGF